MTADRQMIEAPQPQRRALCNVSLHPATPEQAVSHLSACLALVRPAGMGNDAAEEWLAVAANELRELPDDILADACAEARKTCTHHGQIVPKVLEASSERMANRRKFHEPRIPIERRIEESRWQPKPGELDEIKRQVAESLKAR